MDFVKVFFMSIGSIIALFISTKVIGNKQMSELSMFDYINGITIGSIAAEMATALENDFYYPLMAIAIYYCNMDYIHYKRKKRKKPPFVCRTLNYTYGKRQAVRAKSAYCKN